MIPTRVVRAGWVSVALVLSAASLGPMSGCGSGSGQVGDSAARVADPPPPPPGEMSSDDYIEQQSKARAKPKAGARPRR
jgi:hypothetical protein